MPKLHVIKSASGEGARMKMLQVITSRPLVLLKAAFRLIGDGPPDESGIQGGTKVAFSEVLSIGYGEFSH